MEQPDPRYNSSANIYISTASHPLCCHQLNPIISCLDYYNRMITHCPTYSLSKVQCFDTNCQTNLKHRSDYFPLLLKNIQCFPLPHRIKHKFLN